MESEDAALKGRRYRDGERPARTARKSKLD